MSECICFSEVINCVVIKAVMFDCKSKSTNHLLCVYICVCVCVYVCVCVCVCVCARARVHALNFSRCRKWELYKGMDHEFTYWYHFFNTVYSWIAVIWSVIYETLCHPFVQYVCISKSHTSDHMLDNEPHYFIIFINRLKFAFTDYELLLYS